MNYFIYKKLFLLFALIFIGCNNNITSSAGNSNLVVKLGSDVGGEQPIVISDLKYSTVKNNDKYSDNSLDKFYVFPSDVSLSSFEIVSVEKADFSGLDKEDFGYDPHSRRFFIKKGTAFGSQWGWAIEDTAIVTLRVSAEGYTPVDLKIYVILKAKIDF